MSEVIFVIVLFMGQGLTMSLGWLGTHYIDYADLKPREICLSQLPEHWN